MRVSTAIALLLLGVPRTGAADEPARPEPDRGSAALQPLEPEREEAGGRPPPTLRRTRDGLVWESWGFDARVRDDGSLELDDNSPVQVLFPAFDLDVTVDLNTERRLEGERPAGRLDEVDLARAAREAEDLSLRLQIPVTIPIPLILGLFDLTEIVQLLRGEDPHYYQRGWILRETEALRNRLADEDREIRTERSLAEVGPRIRRIWREPRRPVAERRAEIFDAWDECEEGTEVGEEARRTIECFVRESIPEGSRHAFRAEELRAFNARRGSHREFAPYRPPGAARGLDPACPE